MRRNTANIKAKSVLGKLGKMYCLNMARQIERGREEILILDKDALFSHYFVINLYRIKLYLNDCGPQ